MGHTKKFGDVAKSLIGICGMFIGGGEILGKFDIKLVDFDFVILSINFRICKTRTTCLNSFNDKMCRSNLEIKKS